MTESEYHNPFAAPQIQDTPTVPSGTVDFAALKTASTGLRLIYIALLLIVIAVLGGVALAFVSQGPGRGAGLALIAVMSLLAISVGLLLLIGVCLCTTVPSESRAKGLAISSAVLMVLQVLFSLFAGFGFGLLSSFAMNLFSSIAMLLFVLFMRNLSYFIHREDLARRALHILIFQLLMFLGGGALFFALITSGSSMAIAGGLVAMLASLILFVMYANLVNDLGTAIRNPNQKPSEKHFE